MFKEIIASVLLTSSIGATNISKHNASNNFRGISGAYCLRGDLETVPVSTGYYSIDFSYSGNMYFYDTDISTYAACTEFTLSGLTAGVPSFTVGAYIPYLSDYEYVRIKASTGAPYDTSEVNAQRFVIYFADTIYVDSFTYEVFTTLFTNRGNPYVNAYTGWFTFYDEPIDDGVVFNLYGSFSADNTLFNNMRINQVGDTEVLFESPNGGLFYLYDDGGWHAPKTVYFGGILIPADIYESLNDNFGNFDFVPTSYNATFYDLLFGLADVPVKIIVDMFDFNLLGVQLSVAILSICTLLVMCALAKLIIRFL